jgi:NAD(P)-dependent dehydrogenase (short-subunit alcohol dehydrogenase family)
VATRAIEAFGPIDVLINNAGTSVQALTWIAGDRAEARSVFETNLWSPLALVAAVAPQMIERGKGVIVNTGSMVQVSPFPHLGHYCASRAAVAQLTQTLQLELGLRGIRVVEVAFGAIDTAASSENRMLRGGPKWLDGRPGLGKLDDAALTLVQAVEGTAEGVVFYPSVLRWVHVFPGFGRRHARRAARKADLADTTLRVGGSAGSAEIRAARERWEAQHVQTS